jgi:hypothetical protein
MQIVIDPIREIKFEGHAFETTPEQWTHVQAALDMGKNVLESHDLATRYCRRVENRNCRYLDVIFP